VKSTFLTTGAKPSAANCFRLYLQIELGRRCARSPRYSLRAFAKYLGVNHATLSQILRGKRPLTARTVNKIGVRLGLEQNVIDNYVANLHLADPLCENSSLREVHQLAHDAAFLISDWHHYAILELMQLDDFKPDTRWIARVLGLSFDEVNVALTRLVRLGLLEMTSRDRWTDQSGNAALGVEGFTQATIQRLSEQVRRLFLAAMEAGAARHWEHTSTTLAIHTAYLPAVRSLLAKLRRDLFALLDQEGPRNDVYQVEISLFPLTKPTKKESDHGSTGHAMANPGEGAR
jgi:uncharacterized protein (TIGR02147 family)